MRHVDQEKHLLKKIMGRRQDFWYLAQTEGSYLTEYSRSKCSKRSSTKILFGVLREICAMEINVNCMFRKTFDWQPRCFASETTEVYRYDVIPRASTVGLSEQSGKDLIHHEVKCTMVFDIDSIVCTFVKHASPGIVLNTLGLEWLSWDLRSRVLSENGLILKKELWIWSIQQLD